MLSIRLERELEQKIETRATLENLTKTELVKKALSQYFNTHTASPYHVGKDLFGKVDGGDSEMSTTYKARIQERLHEKYHN